MEAVDEAIDIAHATGVHVEIVHLKCSGIDNWGKAAQILDKIALARAQGCDIDCDCLSLHGWRQPAEKFAAWLGANWRQRGDARAPGPAGNTCANKDRDRGARSQ